MLLTAGIGLIPYALSRYGYYEIATLIATISTTAIVLLSALSSYGIVTFKYLLLPILLVSIFLSARIRQLYTALSMIGVLTVIFLLPRPLDIEVLLDTLSFLWVGINLIMVLDYARSALEKKRVEALRQANQALEEEIAERRKAEHSLRLLSTAIEQSSEGIVITDLDGNILFANEAKARLFGQKVESLLGQPISVLVSAKQAPILIAHLQQIKERKDISDQFETTRADGTVFPAHYRSSLVRDENGQPVAIIHLLRDISDLKQLEQQRIALTLEKERINLLTHFITHISHEFRTPLANINTSLYLHARLKDPEKRAAQLNIIREQAAQIKNLIEAILTMVRLDNHSTFTFAPCHPETFIHNIEEEMRPLAEAKDLSFTIELAPGIPSLIVDSQMLHLALTQIVRNAIMYTSEGAVTIRVDRQGEFVTIAVHDTGIGIRPDDLAHIFDRFYRSETARSIRGMGLGLVMARKAIEGHGGRIEVESTPGEGSTFRILLPLEAQPHPRP